ncbi:MAG: signal peptide peptidase SppA, partial [Rikenellaceae bacterium]
MNFFKIFISTLLSFFVCMLVLVVVVCGSIVALASALGEAPTLKRSSVLVVDLREPIYDTPELNPLSSFDISTLSINPRVALIDILKALESAATDPDIEGIYIRPRSGQQASVSLANLEEIRGAIEEFKKCGKFVVAYADRYSQGEYYLASVADSLYLQPEGLVGWQGLASTPIYYKGLLDKLDVKVEVFRPSSCSYKSAVEPYTRSGMSSDSRRQGQDLVNSLWGVITQSVAESRRLSIGELNRFADELTGASAHGALESGLVDDLLYEDEVRSKLEELGAVKGKRGNLRSITLSNYILLRSSFEAMKSEEKSDAKVGVIYAEGAIYDGEGALGEVGSSSLCALLRRAREDKSVKSVVLRVNSPGGSALAADVIWREMVLLREQKPIIVSMGGYAASGGYYISAPADAIVADRLTLTGSIGVYSMIPDVEGALDSKLGITTDVVKSNASADFMRTMRPLNATERAAMALSVDNIYETFTSHVSQGRNIPLERTLEIAQGKVWSGEEALTLGLIDSNLG